MEMLHHKSVPCQVQTERTWRRSCRLLNPGAIKPSLLVQHLHSQCCLPEPNAYKYWLSGRILTKAGSSSRILTNDGSLGRILTNTVSPGRILTNTGSLGRILTNTGSPRWLSRQNMLLSQNLGAGSFSKQNPGSQSQKLVRPCCLRNPSVYLIQAIHGCLKFINVHSLLECPSYI